MKGSGDVVEENISLQGRVELHRFPSRDGRIWRRSKSIGYLLTDE